MQERSCFFTLSPLRLVILSSSNESNVKQSRRTTANLAALVFLAEVLEGRVLLSGNFNPPADPRIITNLDASWRFLRSDAVGAQANGYDDSAWSAISLPHTWNALDGQDGGSNYYRGVGWYRRHVTPAVSNAGKRLYLKFDGANSVTDLYVNGTLV